MHYLWHLLERCQVEGVDVDSLDKCIETSITPLGSFLVRQHLLYHVLRNTCWPLSNKHFTALVRFLDAFSVDIATGKVWTAVLFLLKRDYNMVLRTLLTNSFPAFHLMPCTSRTTI